MKKLLTVLVAAGTAVALTACEPAPTDGVPWYECDVTQTEFQQQPQMPVDWNTDGMLVICVSGALDI